MEERTWAKRLDQEMNLKSRISSRDRGWTGLVATIYDASAGCSEETMLNNNISMHVGAPALVTSRCDGEAIHRLQIPGDIKIVPAGYSRVWEIERETAKLVMSLNATLVYRTAEEIGINPDGAAITPQLHLRDPRIEHIGWALKEELEADDPLGRLYAESLGVALVVHLLRRYAPVSPRVAFGLSKMRLRRITDYIHEHLATDLSLSELARVADVSPSHFNVLFKKAVGVPVHQYVVRTRVEYAIDLIVAGGIPLSQVALQSGFANQGHMARSMRRIAGMTPGSLRRGLQ
jgi:AraC family transcriptional regulator